LEYDQVHISKGAGMTVVRRAMIVVTNEFRFWEGFGEQDSASAVAATDVGSLSALFEFLLNAVKRRDP
jgi:hypothetical protein